MLGKLITISGLDGAGKTTQIDLMTEYLNKKNISVKYIWSRGGYTPGFLLLKDIIRKLAGKKVPSAGRTSEREKKLKNPKIAKLWLTIAIIDLFFLYAVYFRLLMLFGRTIIADRYIWDTLIDFRLNFENINVEKMFLWKVLVFCAPVPDVPLYLDIPLDISVDRLSRKDEPFPDSKETLSNRLDNYKELNEQAKWKSIDAMQPIEKVHSDIVKELI
ncbi:hypothetical protein YH65_07110 [Sulfurovum lithotrophicum]|uniref:Thymidylate kinase-like domain-containing protein n=1 Tax=Sulfurovum lithotrophicum TaxID=206403 RepID=A0A7U4M1K2_9BACT|nr:hypothetical protein [Sulfurovum lithotrophicum]AKF25186.1 hypothetical protein YH65_07110 [Sulfurovum lithotrophicum]